MSDTSGRGTKVISHTRTLDSKCGVVVSSWQDTCDRQYILSYTNDHWTVDAVRAK